MTESAPRQRVAIYVVRHTNGSPELLVFDHVDAPEAGTQIPAGGIDPGEPILGAAIREVREETGLGNLEQLEIVATQHVPNPEVGVARFTTFVRAVSDCSQSSWIHEVSGDGEDEGMQFRCYFIPLEDAQNVLHWEQTEFLDRLK